MVGAPPASGRHAATGSIVWEFQPDGVFIEQVPGCACCITGYLYQQEPQALYLLRCDEQDQVRPDCYRIITVDGGRMFLERSDESGLRIYLFEAERVDEQGLRST